MTARRLSFQLILFIALAGCDAQDMMESVIPQEEVAFAKAHISLLQARRLAEAEAQISPSLRSSDLQAKLTDIAYLFPPTEPIEVLTVGSQIFITNGQWTANLTFQYEFPEQWLLAAVSLARNGDQVVVTGINVQPLDSSLQDQNSFSIQRRGVIGYIFLLLAVLVPLFVLTTFVICLRTPIPKRKWLWALFVLIGFSPVSLNWATGEVSHQMFGLMLFGAAAVTGGPYAPWIISFAAPLGAAAFLTRRKAWIVGPPRDKA